jgi:hypothetical protein
MMDWQAAPGQANAGLLGTMQSDECQAGDEESCTEGAVCFGAIGADEVDSNDDVFLLLAPQHMTGASLHEPLSEMCECAVRTAGAFRARSFGSLVARRGGLSGSARWA